MAGGWVPLPRHSHTALKSGQPAGLPMGDNKHHIVNGLKMVIEVMRQGMAQDNDSSFLLKGKASHCQHN